MIRLSTSAGRSGPDGSDQQLEADVMRFVAIIALCIVAISTLVENTAPSASAVLGEPESVPVATAPRVPTPPMVAAPPASPPESASARAGGAVAVTSEPDAVPRAAASAAPPRPGAGEAAIESPAREAAARPEPSAVQPPTDELTVFDAQEGGPSVAEPRPAASTDAVPAPPVVTPPERRSDDAGFTLRFASDAALLRLVGRGEAGLYVFDRGATLRLDFGPNGAAFAPAPGPGQYHEIAAATVPDLLRRTLARRDRRSTDVVWGVTLPPSTRAALARLIGDHGDHRSGELVIDERGRVRLETQHDRT